MGRGPHLWTAQRVKRLRALWPDHDATSVGRAMGLSVVQVKNAVQRLRLKAERAGHAVDVALWTRPAPAAPAAPTVEVAKAAPPAPPKPQPVAPKAKAAPMDPTGRRAWVIDEMCRLSAEARANARPEAEASFLHLADLIRHCRTRYPDVRMAAGHESGRLPMRGVSLTVMTLTGSAGARCAEGGR